MARKRAKQKKTLWDAFQSRLWAAASREVLSPFTMGLAHDLNNLLTGVCSMSELCLQDAGAESQFRERLEMIRNHGQCAAELVQSLFREHQAQPGRSEYHDLNKLTEAGLDLVRRAIPRSIQIEQTLASQPLPVFLDAIAFRTILLHLAINAAEAIEGKGVLTVRTSLHQKVPRLSHFKGKRASPAACLQVSDSGAGIDPKQARSIWDPLFSTKAAYAGAGLGLFLARTFAEASGGGLSVDIAGRGMTLRLWLPEASFTELKPGSKRQHVVLAGKFGLQTAAIAKELRSRNCDVTVVSRADEMLLRTVPRFDLLAIASGTKDSGAARLIRAIRRQQLPGRILTFSGNARVDSSLLAKIDLNIPGRVNTKAVVGQIEQLLP